MSIDSDIILKVERLEEVFYNSHDVEEILSLLESNPVLAQNFLYANEYPSLNLLAERTFTLYQQDAIDTLYGETNSIFGDFEPWERELKSAFARLNLLYPQPKEISVQTMVSGLFNDLYITQDNIVIGLDWFLGENATYRPLDIPQYLLKRYSPDYLVPTVMKFVINPYCRLGSENTLLSEMIDFGKVYYLLNEVLPCTDEHLLIGFSKEEMDAVHSNHEVIWANFIYNEILYETSEFTKKKFLGERPNVYEIGDKCPGRIGAWLGWQIVSAYMENSNISVQELMNETDHHKIFANSNYKPRNVSPE